MGDADLRAEIEAARANAEALRSAVARTFLGHAEEVELLLLAFFAEGHVLLEGLPGLGKTTLLRALAAAMNLEFRRIQFTPDLVPADVLGTRILNTGSGGGTQASLVFEKGPLFAEVVLADEINRATPRTQAALLEAMQERQVTAFGETYPLGPPFFLAATQNPIELEGTYPLPEAQLDRFLFKIELGLPERGDLESLLSGGSAPPLPEPVVSRDQVLRLHALVPQVPVSSEMVSLVASLVLATHPDQPAAPPAIRQNVRAGTSPRGGLALLAAARARALLHGRLHVAAEDIERLAPAALGHRLLLSYEGEARGVRPRDLVREALERARAGIE